MQCVPSVLSTLVILVIEGPKQPHNAVSNKLV